MMRVGLTAGSALVNTPMRALLAASLAGGCREKAVHNVELLMKDARCLAITEPQTGCPSATISYPVAGFPTKQVKGTALLFHRSSTDPLPLGPLGPTVHSACRLQRRRATAACSWQVHRPETQRRPGARTRCQSSPAGLGGRMQ
jgi:hypothetical protein